MASVRVYNFSPLGYSTGPDYKNQTNFARVAVWNDLFRIRIRIFYFWIADPDPAREKGCRVIIMLVIASPPAKTTKLCLKK